MGKRILITILITVLSVSQVWATPLDKRVKLTGDAYSTKAMSIWQLHKYKYTKLLRKSPLCWCPYLSYTYVDKYVTIEDRNNRNWIIVRANLKKLVQADYRYNKAHAKRYKGTQKQKVKKIYRYCKRTKYVAHVKTAKQVIQTRTGDCAGIASAFYVMCKKNHIPVRYVIGWTEDSCHAWNRVKIGKRWYWIDATMGLWISKKQFPNRKVMEIW